MVTPKTLILGGGMTGLAAGIASGLPDYQAALCLGRDCSPYYVRSGSIRDDFAAGASFGT